MHGKNTRVFIILSLRRTGDDLHVSLHRRLKKLKSEALRYPYIDQLMEKNPNQKPDLEAKIKGKQSRIPCMRKTIQF